MSAIQVSGLTKQFGDSIVVDQLDLTVHDAEFVALLGPSGCGKTTTLRCIAGLETPDEGRICIGERSVVDCDTRFFLPAHKRGIGMVFQSYALWPHMSVFENVAYPLRAQRRGHTEITARVEDALKLVGLGGFGPRATSELSGGQQQRVSLARALVGEPRVLLLDEPLSNLDAGLRTQLRQAIRRIHLATRTTSLYVTHDQVEAITLADRIVVINAGHVEQIGTPREIYLAPANKWVAGFVGYENFLPAVVTDIDGDLVRVAPERWNGHLECHAHDPDSFRPGDAVEVAIRSSSFSIADSDGANVLSGTVGDASYLGDFIAYELTVPGITVTIQLPEREAARLGKNVGENARFAVAPEQLVLVRSEEKSLQPGQPAYAHVR